MKYRRKFLLPITETGIGEVKSSRMSTGVKIETGEVRGTVNVRGHDWSKFGPTKFLDLGLIRLPLTNEVEKCSERYPNLFVRGNIQINVGRGRLLEYEVLH